MATINELEPNTPGDGPHQLRLSHLDADFAPKAVVGEIFAKATEQALLPRLGAEQIEVTYGQTVIPVTVTEPQAGQVGVGTSNEQREGGVKPLSGVGWGSRSFSPVKFAVIVTASDEFVRQNPQNRFNSIRGKLSAAIARQMDLAVFHGRDALLGTALQGIDVNNVLVNTTNVVAHDPAGANAGNLINDLLALYDLIGEDYDPERWVFDPRYRTKLAAAMRGVDANGNVLSPGDVNLAAQESSVLGLPANFHKAAPGRIGAYAGPTPPVRAFLGDFSQLKWGFADEIRFKVSDQATLSDGTNTVNLWQTNQVAVMCEVTFGWVVGDLEAFAKLTEVDTP
jgi:HK97 family phage major capsid protein